MIRISGPSQGGIGGSGDADGTSGGPTGGAGGGGAGQRGAIWAGAATLTDDELCDLLRRDAAAEIAAGRLPGLGRYLRAIPTLTSNPAALDTAIQLAIDASVKLGAPREAAAARMAAEHPELREAIEISSILDAMLATSSVWRDLATAASPLQMPCEFGPPWRDGQSRYLLVECVAMGAHGTIYRAQDRALSAPDRVAWAAIKTVHVAPALGFDAARREAVRARRIDHPNVARVLEAGQAADGSCYLAFEFVEGRSLATWRRGRSERTPSDEAARIVMQAAEGLAASHAAGVTHGDLHPGNVMIGGDGQVKVIDFGLGRLPFESVEEPAAGAAIGFVAPEVHQRRARARMDLADVYSAGALLYWLLTDRNANGDSVPEAEERLEATGGEPSDPRQHRAEVDEDLAWITRRALEPDAARRYTSAAALASDLQRYLAREPLAWRPPSALRRARLAARRSPILVSALVGSVMLLVSLAGLGVTVYWRAALVSVVAERDAATARAEASAAQTRALEAETREQDDRLQKLEGVKRVLQSMASFVSSPPLENTPPDRLVTWFLLADEVSVRSTGAVLMATDPQLKRRLEAGRRRMATLLEDPERNGLALFNWRCAMAVWLVEADQWEAAREMVREARAYSAATTGARSIDDDLARLDEVAELMLRPDLNPDEQLRLAAIRKLVLPERVRNRLTGREKARESGRETGR